MYSQPYSHWTHNFFRVGAGGRTDGFEMVRVCGRPFLRRGLWQVHIISTRWIQSGLVPSTWRMQRVLMFMCTRMQRNPRARQWFAMEAGDRLHEHERMPNSVSRVMDAHLWKFLSHATVDPGGKCADHCLWSWFWFRRIWEL